MAKTLGDFTGLAQHYALYRAGYASSAVHALLGLLRKPTAELDFVDVGAGTGIWTRQLARLGWRSVRAVEPNADMRAYGLAGNDQQDVQWFEGSAEQTGLPDGCCDMVSMASSFHWADFEQASRELSRVLRPGGRFVAVWNPRLVRCNPLLVEIEDYLHSLSPALKRVSSGRSSFTDNLTERLWESPCWTDVVYLEGRHVEQQTPERYLGLWRSVNDIQVQLGAEKFAQFLDYIEAKTIGLEFIEATYQTRVWSALRQD
jgi:SAM-dependent methyltransferase